MGFPALNAGRLHEFPSFTIGWFDCFSKSDFSKQVLWFDCMIPCWLKLAEAFIHSQGTKTKKRFKFEAVEIKVNRPLS